MEPPTIAMLVYQRVPLIILQIVGNYHPWFSMARFHHRISEAMEVHRQLVQARRNDEDAQLRQAQDQEPRNFPIWKSWQVNLRYP